MSSTKDIPFGIDFGTSNMCVSYFNNKYNFIIDSTGSALIPTIIRSIDNRIVIGNDANTCSVDNINENIITSIKRLIGVSYNNIIDTHIYNFLYTQNEDSILIKLGNEYLSIKEIIVLLLKKLSDIVKDNIGIPIKNAVITVPAYFTDNQRSIIKESAALAGIDLLKIINEPTAAAIAVISSKKIGETCLVYDLGGGTLDVTILEYDADVDTYNVIETTGNSSLGGDDFNNKLVEYCLKNFCAKYKLNVTELASNYKLMRKLIAKCKECRENLSTLHSYEIYIDDLYSGYDMIIMVTRALFENICMLEFSKAATILNKLTDKQIDHIILVGGASRMPKIRKILESKYPNSKLYDDVDPDTVVALGASIVAHKININNPIILLDVIPLPIGIETNGMIMTRLIEKNEHIPIKRLKVVTTEYDNQPSFSLNVYEGEYFYARQNHHLGTIIVKNLPLMKKGELKIFIKFKVDNNGILDVSVKYCDIKLKDTFIKTLSARKIDVDNNFSAQIELCKFKEYLINMKYICEERNINTSKICKLINWITCSAEKIGLSLDSIIKMRKYIETEIEKDIGIDNKSI